MANRSGTKATRRQLGFKFRPWGGPRKRAGRKPKGDRAGVPHRRRDVFRRRSPLHVTLRMADTVYNLRSRRAFGALERALYEGSDRFGLRLVQFSVQGDHLHLLIEAEETGALLRGMKGLSIRIAKALNRMMRRRGRVIGDRYHSRVLRTPSEVRRLRGYIRNNHRRHMAGVGQRLPDGWRDPFSSESPALGFTMPKPRGWLLSIGWRRGAP